MEEEIEEENTLDITPDELDGEFTIKEINNSEDDDETPESPDVDLDIKLMERIRSMFDAGSTRSIIAKELNLDRADVIEVLSKYVGRAKINGRNTQVIDFKFDATGKKRVELGDRLNTSIYVKDGGDIEAAKKKWLKILNNKND